jgi:hypothetical protein
MIKRFFDLFRDENQDSKGWLRIKGKHFGLDKQKHVVLGTVFFIILSFFIGIESAAAWTVVLAIAKEVSDHVGLTNKIFKTGKTAASFPDILVTIIIPILVQVINLYLL